MAIDITISAPNSPGFVKIVNNPEDGGGFILLGSVGGTGGGDRVAGIRFAGGQWHLERFHVGDTCGFARETPDANGLALPAIEDY